jgi:hypothetical protein
MLMLDSSDQSYSRWFKAAADVHAYVAATCPACSDDVSNLQALMQHIMLDALMNLLIDSASYACSAVHVAFPCVIGRPTRQVTSCMIN